MMIDAGPKFYVVQSPTPYMTFKVKVMDLEFLYWSLCLSFRNVCFCEAFDGLIYVWHGDRNWSKILYGTFQPRRSQTQNVYIKVLLNVGDRNWSKILYGTFQPRRSQTQNVYIKVLLNVGDRNWSKILYGTSQPRRSQTQNVYIKVLW